MRKSILFLIVLLLSIGNSIQAQISDKTITKAESLYENGDYREVIKMLKPAGILTPINTHAEMLLADAYHKQEDFFDAVEHYNRAEEGGEESFELYFHRARALISITEFKKASKDMSKAIAMQPDNAQLYFFRAYAETEMNNLNHAILDYSKAIELDPDYQEAYFNRGAVQIDLEQYVGGVSDLEKAQSLDPENIDAALNLAIISYQQQKYEEALPLFESIIENTNDKQNKLDANYYIAECYDAMGDVENACHYFYKAMKLGDKDSGEIYENYCENNQLRTLFKPRKKLEKVSF